MINQYVKLATVAATLATSATMVPGAMAASPPTPSVSPATKLQEVIAKGDQEINRRFAKLSVLSAKIDSATKLTASDKATLSAEVVSTTSGLHDLKSRLDGETTLSAARTDVTDIYTEYRVYALVAPKVGLIKVADDQQVVEGKLLTLASKLETRIDTAKKAGRNVTSLQTELNEMIAKANAAQNISSSIESSTINLQPSDYNSNHALLAGDNVELGNARADNKQAYQEAKTVVAGLKSLQ